MGVATLVLAAGLPVLGHWLRGPRAAGCALDGVPIHELLRVRIIDATGIDHDFCGLACAEGWLRASGTRAARILVTDESSGRALEADAAYYVRSRALAHAGTRDHRHVFATRTAAETHTRAFGGRLLNGSQRPFARDLRRPTADTRWPRKES